MTDRYQQLRAWVEQVVGAVLSWEPLIADASFRRYIRVGAQVDTYIVMDAPPDHEDCRLFVQMAHRLAQQGVLVPEVYAQDLQRGFLLLRDLGDVLYLDILQQANAETLYTTAVDTLLKIQQAPMDDLPVFDDNLYRIEFERFEQWYWRAHHHRQLTTAEEEQWAKIKRALVDALQAQPRVFVHRDYHSRNLMWLDGAVGVLDFQDAVQGPVTYDLLSMWRDCYIDWPEELVTTWLQGAFNKMSAAGLPVGDAFDQFHQWFDWASVQRHLKCLGIFARLSARYQRPSYLAYLPRVEQYLHRVSSRYEALRQIPSFLGAGT